MGPEKVSMKKQILITSSIQMFVHHFQSFNDERIVSFAFCSDNPMTDPWDCFIYLH